MKIEIEIKGDSHTNFGPLSTNSVPLHFVVFLFLYYDFEAFKKIIVNFLIGLGRKRFVCTISSGLVFIKRIVDLIKLSSKDVTL